MKQVKEKQGYLSKIKKVITFRFLGEEERQHILDNADVLIYEDGEAIINQGDTGENLYAVLEGTVNVTVTEKTGNEVYLNAIGQGQVFGEAAIFLKVERTATIRSPEKAVILRIGRKDFISFIKTYKNAGIKILMMIIYSLLGKLKASNEELAFERRSDIDQADIDDFIDDFLKEI